MEMLTEFLAYMVCIYVGIGCGYFLAAMMFASRE